MEFEKVNLEIEATGIDEAISKAKALSELISDAKQSANELAALVNSPLFDCRIDDE